MVDYGTYLNLHPLSNSQFNVYMFPAGLVLYRLITSQHTRNHHMCSVLFQMSFVHWNCSSEQHMSDISGFLYVFISLWIPAALVQMQNRCGTVFAPQWDRTSTLCQMPEHKHTCTDRKQHRGWPSSRCETSAADGKPGNRSPGAWIQTSGPNISHHPEKGTRTGSGSAVLIDLAQSAF